MAENTSNSGAEVFVATRTAHVDYEGRRTLIRKGKTRVRGDHDLVKAYPDLFEAASNNLEFDVEDTVSRPGMVTRGSDGGRRGVKVTRRTSQATPGSEAPAEPYQGHGKQGLHKLIAERNEGRDEEHQIKVERRANLDALKAALVADDEATAAKVTEEVGPTEPADPVDLGEPPHKENQTDTTSPVKNEDAPEGGGAGDGNS